MKKILLIVPPTGKYIREDRCQTPIEKLKTVALRPPIDLMYAAASFESAGCDCRLMDFPAELKSWEDLKTAVKEFAPEILAISITTPSLARDVEAARLVKDMNPAILTIAKGAHFNTLDVDSLKRILQNRESGINNANTFGSLIMVLKPDPELYVSAGRPDREPFRRFRFGF